MSRTDSVQADFSAQFAQLQERLKLVLNRISTACRDARRDPRDVRLIAVSKTCPAEAVRAAQAAGQMAFGENYVQEGVDKIAALRSIQPGTLSVRDMIIFHCWRAFQGVDGRSPMKKRKGNYKWRWTLQNSWLL